MREIKFEYVARNKKLGNLWREVYTLEEIIAGRKILTFFATDNENCEMLARRQFIGLKDKNDVEIYEGDLVETQEGIAKIEWCSDPEHLGFTASTLSGYGHREVEFWWVDSKVISNIYEKPELLREEES